MKLLKMLVWWTWCLPQMLVATLLFIFCKISKKVVKTEEVDGRKYIYVKLKSGSVSLGRWVFLGECHWERTFVKLHEYGHTKQSLILGWFYLIIIGLPSLIWANCFSNYRIKRGISYYVFYTEKWANKLMGL